jgi:hypothetical protein
LRTRTSALGEALVALAVVLAFALVGVAAGFGWHAWWAPAPKAVVYRREPYFMPDGEFRSTGMYVAIAVPAGLALGILVTWWRRRDPLVAVLAALAGSVAAGAIMLGMGLLLGPGDPTVAARHTAEMATVPGMLRAQPGAAWCAFPFGTMLGALIVLLLVAPPVENSGE